MARGPKKHLKRLAAPRSWMLSKMGGTWAPKPSPGPHRLRESLPLSLILRNRLKYALTRREVIIITARRLVKVDHKIRTDLNFPTGFMDVLTIDKTDEAFRVLYDTKGRFVLHRLPADETQFKLARVKSVRVAKKASAGHNPFKNGTDAAIPCLVTHDGRTIRYPDPVIKANDTVKIDLKTGKITGHLKFEVNNIAMVTRGSNIGRVGVIVHTDRHPGSFDIVHLRDRQGATFATRLSNVFVIGEGIKPWISLPKGKGVKVSILEERDKKHGGKKTEKREKPVKEEKKPKAEEKPSEPEKQKDSGKAPKDGGKKEAPKDGGKKAGGQKAGGQKDGGQKDGGQKAGGQKDGGQKDGGQKAGGQKDGGQKDGGQKDGGQKDGGKKDGGKKDGQKDGKKDGGKKDDGKKDGGKKDGGKKGAK